MQDIEFTIQDGKLYMLQTRSGKRTAQAAVRIAVEMVDEGLIDEKTAVSPGGARHSSTSSAPALRRESGREGRNRLRPVLPASPGAAVGRAVFFADDAEKWAARGEQVILVRDRDVAGGHRRHGRRRADSHLPGGMTSHAAVVARGMGKCCVAGAGDIAIDEATKQFTVDGDGRQRRRLDLIDGATGEVMLGQLQLSNPEAPGRLRHAYGWADKYPHDEGAHQCRHAPRRQVARDFGAEGIGLCRTEHMFFAEDRIERGA